MDDVLLIGAGRVAYHLGHAWTEAGVPIVGVAARDKAKGEALAGELGTHAFSLGGTLPASRFRAICVSDDAIESVAGQLPASDAITFHTSGAKSVMLLGDHARKGVLWPIQSFSPGTPMDLSGVPLVIDAEDASTLDALRTLADKLSATVVELTREKRELLHLSAVLASNFPVFLLMRAEELLTRNGISPELLHPLWLATSEKAEAGAEKALTGPARRGDVRTIAQHLDRLTSDPDLRRAYAVLSDMILATYHPEKRAEQDLQGDPR